MTDPTGRSFISYRRSRATEVAALVAAHHDHGVPTWQDIADLETGPTEDQLRSMIRNPETANGVMWVTPELANSQVIRTIEAPELFLRARARDGFFLVPVAAGGLTYADASSMFNGIHPAHDLRTWNVLRAESNGEETDVRHVLNEIVDRRIKAIHQQLSPGDPIRIRLYSRARAPFEPGFSFTFDWEPAFVRRVAKRSTWDNRLLPALHRVADAVRLFAPGRPVEAEGLTSMPGALALGSAFAQVRGVRLGWRQMTNGELSECWSLGSRTESGFRADLTGGDTSASDIAVLVEVTDVIGPALVRSGDVHPPFRSTITVRRAGPVPHRIDCETAVDIAMETIRAIRETRATVPGVSAVHLFIAGPLVLAVMIGQLLNTVGPVQTYEHIPDEGPGRYAPGCLITTS